MLVGGLQSGWMAYDGRHKLVKYGNGADRAFDLQEDSQEQHNLAESASHAAEYRHLTLRSGANSCAPYRPRTPTTWFTLPKTSPCGPTGVRRGGVGAGLSAALGSVKAVAIYEITSTESR